MKWTLIAEGLPIAGECVLGLVLNRYSNAEWTWSVPYVYTFDGKRFIGFSGSHALMQPDAWARFSSPPLPECDERREALEVEAREIAREREIAAVNAKYNK